MAIALRGALNHITATSNNGNDVTLTLDTITPPLVDDIIVVFGGHGIGTTTLSAPSGNTSGSYIQIGIHTGTAPIFGMWFQKMGATPDTSILCSGGGNTADAGDYGCYVLSGVDTTTAQDAAATTAGPTTSTNPNPASITTVTNDAWVIPCAGNDVFDGTPGTISGYINDLAASRNETNDLGIAAATLEKSTFGAEDPGAWSTWSSGTWYAITAAFRPAVAADITIPVPVGSLVLTGLAPVAVVNRTLSPATATLVLTGEIPTLVQTFNHIRAPPVGSLTATGLVPTPLVGRTIAVPVGSLTATGFAPPTVLQPSDFGLRLTGFVPTVTVTTGDTTIPVDAGALTISGLIPTIATSVQVGAGSLSLSGSVPTVIQEFSADPGVGTLTLAGQIPTLATGVQVGAGSLSVTGFAPTLIQEFSQDIPAGSLVLSGSVPSLNITQSVPVPAGSGVFSGSVPLLLQTFSIDIPVGSGVFTGFIPTVVQEFSAEIPVGNISISGLIPTLNITQTVPIPAGSGVFAGSIPTLLQTFSIDVGVGSLSATGFAPTLIQEFSVEPDAGSLSLTGFIPTVTISAADIVVTPGVGSLSLTGFIPTLSFSEIPVPTGTLTITGSAPEVIFNLVRVGAGSLSLTGFVPSVVVTTKGGGRVRRKIRYVVEVDGEAFEVSTIAEAQSILLQVRGLAQQAAQKDVKTVTPKLPQVTVKTIDRATPKTLQQAVTRTQKTITEAYVKRSREIAQDIEISQLIITKIEQQEREDESAIIALLM